MLCAVSPGMGKQYHKWIPHIKRNYTLLLEEAKQKEVQDYFLKYMQVLTKTYWLK
jgi:hypothetical protein